MKKVNVKQKKIEQEEEEVVVVKDERIVLPVKKFGWVTVWTDGHFTVEKRYKNKNDEWVGTTNYYPEEVGKLKGDLDMAIMWLVNNYDG